MKTFAKKKRSKLLLRLNFSKLKKSRLNLKLVENKSICLNKLIDLWVKNYLRIILATLSGIEIKTSMTSIIAARSKLFHYNVVRVSTQILQKKSTKMNKLLLKWLINSRIQKKQLPNLVRNNARNCNLLASGSRNKSTVIFNQPLVKLLTKSKEWAKKRTQGWLASPNSELLHDSNAHSHLRICWTISSSQVINNRSLWIKYLGKQLWAQKQAREKATNFHPLIILAPIITIIQSSFPLVNHQYLGMQAQTRVEHCIRDKILQMCWKRSF